MSGYKFDVFFSYKRDPESDKWHETVARKLEFWLRKEINAPEARIFFDTESIETGEQWNRTIREGLKTSKCLVAVWSPDYFHSPWCIAEWQSFVQREQHLKLKTGSLIAPARYHDGEYFPRAAQNAQMMDFRQYTSTMAFFWDSKYADEFERTVLKPFAKAVAKKIRNAPTYDDKFPLVAADEPPVPSLPPVPRPSDRANS